MPRKPATGAAPTPVMLSIADVAALADVLPKTIVKYRERPETGLPAEDGKIGRSPYWWSDGAIAAWLALRQKGAGNPDWIAARGTTKTASK